MISIVPILEKVIFIVIVVDFHLKFEILIFLIIVHIVDYLLERGNQENNYSIKFVMVEHISISHHCQPLHATLLQKRYSWASADSMSSVLTINLPQVSLVAILYIHIPCIVL